MKFSSPVKILVCLLMFCNAGLAVFLFFETQDLKEKVEGLAFQLENAASVGEKKPREISNIDYTKTQSLGSETAPVKFVMFSDYECYYCREFYREVFAGLKKKYIDSNKVQFFVKHFPSKNHPLAHQVALYESSIQSSSLFWKSHLKLMQDTSPTGFHKLQELANSNGTDTLRLRSILDSLPLTKFLKGEIALAILSGINGIPAFVINKKLYIGNRDLSAFENIIETELNNSMKDNGTCD